MEFISQVWSALDPMAVPWSGWRVGWQVLAFTPGGHPHHHRCRHDLPALLPGAPCLDLHAIPLHFFRFWLWLTTGQVTSSGWRCTASTTPSQARPKTIRTARQAHGIKTVLLTGAELYRKEAKNVETQKKYGHNTPDDWPERKPVHPLFVARRRFDADH